jgi:hypothetical protein
MDRPARRTVVVSLLYAVLSIAFCFPLFARPSGLGMGDWDQHLFYYAETIKNVVEYAQPPFWSPWYCGGNVLWQNPQVALLSPTYPLAAAAGLALAMKINIVLHYWIGLIGMHLLITRVLKLTFDPAVVFLSSVFVFSGACAIHLAVGHSVFLPAFYVPLLLFFFARSLQTGAVRPALYGGALLALTIYNGGLHIVPLTILAVAAFAVVSSVVRRSWQPIVIALMLGVSGAAFAAPKLVPVSLFVTGDRFWDARDQPDHPDRVTAGMLLRVYGDSSQRTGSRFSAAQRHGWWEYGNYIGAFAASLLAIGTTWALLAAPVSDRLFAVPLAATAVMFLVLSLGEFSALAPAALLQQVPLFSSFRIPSRFTIGVVLFAALATATALRRLFERIRLTQTKRAVAAVLCFFGAAQLIVVNRTHFRDVFSQPPLDSGFRVLKGSGQLQRDAPVDPYVPNAPMLRALMADHAVMWCYEGLQLTHGADLERPLVWSSGQAKISDVAFTPNRVEFSVIGTADRSRIFLNQNYAPGWRSSAGAVQLDPQAGGRMFVELAPGQTGRFAFSFVPPGLMLGTVLLLAAVLASVFAWNRTLPVQQPAPKGIPGASFPTLVEQWSKPFVLLSLTFAIALRIALSDANIALAWGAAASFVVALALATRWPAVASVILACTYLAPLIVARLIVYDATAYLLLWMPALVGAMMPRWQYRRWSLPAAWRVPLAGWALAVAVAWPIVAAREFDFHPEPFSLLNRPTSAFGMLTVTSGFLVTETAAALMLAVLWLDWLFAMFAAAPQRLVRLVVIPLLASCAIACGLAVYQLAVDMTFLNAGWGAMGRSGSTMIDANAFGIAAVLGSCAFLALIDPRRSRLWNIAMAAGFGLASVGLWASGSKTALLALLMIIAFAVWARLPRRGHVSAFATRKGAIAIVVAVAAVAILAIAVAGSGPAQRLGRMMPAASLDAVGELAAQLLWRRDGYGSAAIDMIRHHPFVGVGVGTFGIIVGDYKYSHLNTHLGPDNAQNWSRHYLAEFGVLGSLGWIVWGIVMVRAIARSRSVIRERPTAMVLAGGLVAVVAMSQVGLPMTNAAVAMTFWTLLFWFWIEGTPSAAPERGVPGSWQWAVMALVVAAFGIGTLRVGMGSLSVPMRARNDAWGYSYGITRAQFTAAGEEFRWTQQRSVVVVPAEKRVAKVTIWVTRPDIAANPVIARVWHERRLVIDTVLRDHNPVSAYVTVDRDPPWLMVRTYFDRVLPPNARDRGMALQWTFIDAVPPASGQSGSAHLDPAAEQTPIAAAGVDIDRPEAALDVEAKDDVAGRFGKRDADVPRFVGLQLPFGVPPSGPHPDRVRNRPVSNGDVDRPDRAGR